MMTLTKAIVIGIVVSFAVFSLSVNAESKTFTAERFEHLKQSKAGKRWLMVLWSVDCPPCFKELALIQKLRVDKPELAVVLINTDGYDEVENERNKIIEKFQLTMVAQLNFADGMADKSRFLIDSSWYGELPRSYFVEANGKFHGRSGLVNEDILRKWLID